MELFDRNKKIRHIMQFKTVLLREVKILILRTWNEFNLKTVTCSEVLYFNIFFNLFITMETDSSQANAIQK